MGGYSHLFPSGQFPRFIFSWFCVPVYNAVFVPRGAGSPLASLCFTCRVRSARDPETSRDHLLAATCRVAVLDPGTSRDHLID